MRVICSWCEHEGRPALVREKAPLTDDRETHGICSDHLQQMGRGETRWFPAMKRAYCPAPSQSSLAADMSLPLPCYECCPHGLPLQRQKLSVSAGMPRHFSLCHDEFSQSGSSNPMKRL